MFVATGVGLACGSATRPTSGPPRALPHDGRGVLAWVLPDDPSLQSVERNIAAISVVSPTYFRVDPQSPTGELVPWADTPFPRSRLYAATKSARAPVWPLVGCVGACGAAMTAVLAAPERRHAHAAQLLRAAHEPHVDGLVVDYENLEGDAASLSQLIGELAAALHAEGRGLGVAVPEPCGPPPSCDRHPYPYDLAELARRADVLVLMEYDYDVVANAPVAPRDWVAAGLREAHKRVDPRDAAKLYVGMALYGRVSEGMFGDTALLFSEIGAASVRDTPAVIRERHFDASALSMTARVEKGTAKGQLYYETGDTLRARLDHALSEGYGNVALWRLGGEDPSIWAPLSTWRRAPTRHP